MKDCEQAIFDWLKSFSIFSMTYSQVYRKLQRAYTAIRRILLWQTGQTWPEPVDRGLLLACDRR